MRPQYTPEIINKFWESVLVSEDPDECWSWDGPGFDKSTGRVRLRIDQKKYIYAYRLSYELHVGPIPEGMLICHSCDNPICCNPRHLFYGTYLDNNRDAIAKGIIRHPAKLTDDEVREIRRLAATGIKQRYLARRFGVGEMQISRIVRWERRTNVT